MKQSRAIQKLEYNFESTEYDNWVSQVGVWVTFSVLVALWQWHLTLMTPTSCRVDIFLWCNKYSVILTYCFTVTEYKYIPYKWNTILPDSRKTVVYGNLIQPTCSWGKDNPRKCHHCTFHSHTFGIWCTESTFPSTIYTNWVSVPEKLNKKFSQHLRLSSLNFPDYCRLRISCRLNKRRPLLPLLMWFSFWHLFRVLLISQGCCHRRLCQVCCRSCRSSSVKCFFL